MMVLWRHKEPITAMEIVVASESQKTWKSGSVHMIIKSLLKKGAVKVGDLKLSSKSYARAYVPTLTYEEYFAMTLGRFESEISLPGFLTAFMKNKNFSDKTKIALDNLINELEKEPGTED